MGGLAGLNVGRLLQVFGVKEFLPSGSVLNKMDPKICRILSTACDIAIFLFCGPTRHENTTRLPVYLSETPAGTSVKNMEHWAQQVRHQTFQMYDYGSAKQNIAKYNSAQPPAYKLSDITVKTALFTGGHDS